MATLPADDLEDKLMAVIDRKFDSFTINVMDRLGTLQSGLEDNTTTTNATAVEVAKIKTRMDDLNLNGSAPALRELGEAAPDLIAIVTHRRDEAVFRRMLQRYIGWNRGLKVIIQLIVTIVITAATWTIIDHIAHAPTLPH